MQIKVDQELIAIVKQSPMAIEYTTIFGKPAIVLESDCNLDIELIAEDAVVDEFGIADLNVPRAEDAQNTIIFPYGKPEEPVADARI